MPEGLNPIEAGKKLHEHGRLYMSGPRREMATPLVWQPRCETVIAGQGGYSLSYAG